MIILIFNPVSSRLFTIITAYYHDLDVEKFYNLIKNESSFRCFAYSSSGAIGLGQVKKETAFFIEEDYPPFLLWIPFSNLSMSVKYLKYLKNRFNNNWSLVLAAYNWGETNVDKRIKTKNIKIDTEKDYSSLFKDIPETKKLLSKILN